MPLSSMNRLLAYYNIIDEGDKGKSPVSNLNRCSRAAVGVIQSRDTNVFATSGTTAGVLIGGSGASSNIAPLWIDNFVDLFETMASPSSSANFSPLFASLENLQGTFRGSPFPPDASMMNDTFTESLCMNDTPSCDSSGAGFGCGSCSGKPFADAAPVCDVEEASLLPCVGAMKSQRADLNAVTAYNELQTQHSFPASSRQSGPSPHRTPSPKFNDSGPTAEEVGPSTLHKKSSHSVAERRYRGNFNDKLVRLQQVLAECMDVKIDTMRSRKSDILDEATNYVYRAERRQSRNSEEIDYLRSRIMSLEKLVNCQDCSLMDQFVGLHMSQTPLNR